MADEDFDYGRFKFLAFGIIAWAALLVFCLFDVLFLAFGNYATASVTNVDTAVTLSRRSRNDLHMEYKFTDSNGEERTGTANIGSEPSVLPEVGETVSIQYLPSWLISSKDISSTRVARGFNRIAMILMLIATAYVAWSGYKAAYPTEVHRPQRRKK